MIILDGKKIELEKTEELKNKVNSLDKKISFGIIQVGNLEESNKYIQKKIAKSKEIGINADWIKFDRSVLEKELIQKINEIKEKYDGIIVQLPLPKHINTQNVLNVIDLDKDIDGLSTQNMSNFYSMNKPYFIPATARAILLILSYYKINLNQNIMVIGESNLVGKPTKQLLSQFAKKIESRNKRTGIKGSKEYDILIVAAGSPKLIKKDDVKLGSIIIDVGVTVIDNKIVGDVDFEDVKDKVAAISPVPGGVGPLTVICLFQNLIDKFI